MFFLTRTSGVRAALYDLRGWSLSPLPPFVALFGADVAEPTVNRKE
jgi:hypothetical protein